MKTYVGVTSVRDNQNPVFKSGKIDLFGEKSGNFIISQGKNQGISFKYLLVIFKDFSRKFRSRLRRSHTTDTS